MQAVAYCPECKEERTNAEIRTDYDGPKLFACKECGTDTFISPDLAMEMVLEASRRSGMRL